MKKLLLLSVLTILLHATSWAYNFKEGSIYYNITSADAKTVEVTYGSSTSNSYSGDVEIPETVTHEETEYTVTGVGYRAFYQCTELTSIVIGNNVTYIGEQAFTGCTNLECELKISDSVTEISSYAFNGCSSLTSLTLGENVASIGAYAFNNCSGLTCDLKIPDSVTELGDRAFTGCTGLTSLTIGSGVTAIGQYTFDGCSSLTSIVIGDGVTTIDQYAFRKCTSLTTLTLGKNVTTIGQYAFYNCSSLEELTIPDSVTKIGNHAFDGCSSVTSLTIGSGVETIGDQAFGGLKSLTELIIPDNVTKISAWAFSGCSGLTSITFGSGLETIEGSAFNGCGTITSITFTSTTPPECDSSAFTYTSMGNCTVYVPVGSEEAYAASEYWGTFTIVEYDEDETLYYDPTVETLEEVTDITYTSATIDGTVTKGTRDIEKLGFEYWTDEDEEDVKTYQVETSITGEEPVTITSELTGLVEGYTYNYRAYAKTKVTKSGTEETFIRTTYGDTQTFTIPTRPTVLTSTATIETYESATLNGSISGGTETTENKYGFEYWIGDEEMTSIEVEGDDMTATIDELAEGTEYSYRAYATTEYGTTYGNTETFTTPTRPTMTTTDATDVTYESATLNGSVSGGTEDVEITDKGFEYWTTEDESEKKTAVVTTDGEEMSATIDELAEATTYNYRAYATTEYGTTYGEVLSFTTLNATLLNSIVTAIEAVQTELTSAWEAIQTDYPDVSANYEETYNDLSAQLATLLTSTEEAYEAGNLDEDAVEEVEASIATLNAGIATMSAEAKTAENQYLYDAITEMISTVETDLTTAWETIEKECADVADDFKTDYEAIVADLTTLSTEMQTAYESETLTQETVTKVEETLATISASIKELSADAAAAEENYQLYTSTVAEIEAVQSKLSSTWSTIQKSYPDAVSSLRSTYNSISSELSTLMQDVEKNKDTMTQDIVSDTESSLASIETKIDNMLTDASKKENDYRYTTAVAEIEAMEAELSTAWSTIQSDCADVADGFEDEYGAIAAELEAVREIVEKAKNSMTQSIVSDTEASLAAIEESIEEMLANAKEAEEQYKLNVTLTGEVEETEATLEDTWEEILSDCADVADDFKEEYEAMKEELDSLLEELEEAYGNGTLTEELAEEIGQKIEEIMEAMDSLISEAKEAEDEYLYNQLYEDAVSEVEVTEKSLEDAWTTIKTKYPDMVEDLQGTHDGIAEEIEAVRTALDETYDAGELTEDAVAEMEESLATIEKEIEDMLANASIATGIDGMAADSDVRVYNLAGSRVHRLERGNVYIFHYMDGTSKKVLVK